MPEDDHVKAAVEEYIAALRANNADAVNSFWADDAVYMAPGMPTRRGRKELESLVAELYRSANVEYITVSVEQIQATSEMAAVMGTSHATVHVKGKAPESKTGRYLWVFRRQTDSRWRLSAAMNTDLPSTW